MNINDYLNQEKLTQAAFGQLLNPPVSQGKVNHWVHGTRRVSLVEAIQIQVVTKGKVTVFDLAKSEQAAEPHQSMQGA